MSDFDWPSSTRDNWAMLPRITPIAPKRIQAPFDHKEFVFELKMDGWRCLTYIEDGKCRLISRKQNQLKSFPPLNAALAKLLLPIRVLSAWPHFVASQFINSWTWSFQRAGWDIVKCPTEPAEMGRIAILP